MQERDNWGNQAVKVDARVEDEWDNIYVDCQDCFEPSSAVTNSFDGARSLSSIGTAEPALVAVSGKVDARASAWLRSKSPSPPFSYSQGVRAKEEEPWSVGRSSSKLAAFDPYRGEGGGKEEEDEDEVFLKEVERGNSEEQEGQETRGFSEEDIIDCAIRGRWSFKNINDPVRKNKRILLVYMCRLFVLVSWNSWRTVLKQKQQSLVFARDDGMAQSESAKLDYRS